MASQMTMPLAELCQRLGDPDLTVVDVRALPAFNGWRASGAARGGHIPGAVAFPIAWLDSVDKPEVERLLQSKGILHRREVILYGADPQDPVALETRLAQLGQTAVRIYGGGWAEWAADPTLPVDRLANYEKLVHADWLRELLDGGRPDAAPVGRDTEGHANEKWPGRRAGQIAACRAGLILRYAGVDDIRLLDGGYDHWVQAGNPLETLLREPVPVASFGVQIPLRPEVIIDIDGAKQILSDQAHAALVSVRTWREHIGAVSGYNYIGPAGRIGGDVWGNCGSDAYHMEHYRNVDNTMRAYPEIAANWGAAGITPDKWVAFYCGTGWRASETWFYADLMGWPRIAVYDGGWFEWSKDPIRNPIEVGEPAAV